MKYKTRDDVAAKVEWEGGLFDAMEYGIDVDDMPDEELRIAWFMAQIAHREWRKRAETICGLLDMEDE